MKLNLKILLTFTLILAISPFKIYANKEETEETKETTKAESTSATENNLSEKDLKIQNIVKKSAVFNVGKTVPKTQEYSFEDGNIINKSTQTLFENGDSYEMSRLSFKEDKPERKEVTIPLSGNTITIRYVDPNTKKWVNTSVLNNIKPATLFIDTDTHSYVISTPGVYKNDFKNSTLTIVREQEAIPVIREKDGYFELKMSFPQNKNLIGEYWFIESKERLVDWKRNRIFDELLSHDLSNERRWSYDGYYFQTPSNYIPGGKDVLYSHPANYTGASFTKYPINNLAKIMGYVMTKVCIKNQNEEGYWATGPKSLWLEKDFKIGNNFYDTRFNTDFAVSLLNAYINYNDKDFLTSAVKYAEFFVDFANNNNYKIDGGGILVEDYGYSEPHEKTHVSLNHHLAELNFLYEIYNITGEKSYLETAEEMLLGVENTRNKWVMPDGNLNYALFYTKDTNKMEDYPYLTYNDLFQTKYLLNKFLNKKSDTIEFLMSSKKQWMDENNITGYLK